MIIVGGHIALDQTKRDAAIEAATEMMAETAKEKGCVTYVFSADFHDPGLFHVFEEWETQADLDAHGESAHMAVFRGKMADFGITERSINRYPATEKTAL